MGQYYQGLLFSKDKTLIASPSDYKQGLKLTEHSWFKAGFMGAVIKDITDNPMRIVWMGDYSGKGDNDTKYNIGCDIMTPEQAYNIVWSEEEKQCTPICPHLNIPETKCSRRGYLINYSKKEYIDLYDYYQQNYDVENGGCLYPLPLLTAIGNGAGGGDYFGDDKDLIGSWAYDIIGYCSDLPSVIYQEIKPKFKNPLK